MASNQLEIFYPITQMELVEKPLVSPYCIAVGVIDILSRNQQLLYFLLTVFFSPYSPNFSFQALFVLYHANCVGAEQRENLFFGANDCHFRFRLLTCLLKYMKKMQTFELGEKFHKMYILSSAQLERICIPVSISNECIYPFLCCISIFFITS